MGKLNFEVNKYKSFKTLNMKKISLFLILFSLILITSCSKDNVENDHESLNNTEVRFKELQAESKFQEFEILQDELVSEIANILEKENITGGELYQLYQNKDEETISTLLRTPEIIKIQENLNLIANDLKTNYPDLLPSISETEQHQVIAIGMKNIKEIDNYSFMTKRKKCNWRYTLCVAAATTAYTACGAGTGGVALLACTAAYAYGMTQCYDRHCK